MSCGIGLTAGPVFGTLLYELGGYTAPFFTFGAVFLFFGVVINRILPKEVDVLLEDNTEPRQEELNLLEGEISPAEPQPSNEEKIEVQSIPMVKLRIWHLFTKIRIFYGLISGCIAYFSWCQMEPIQALRMQDFDFSTMQTGLFFAIFPTCYLISGLLISFEPKWIDNRVYLIVGGLGVFVGLLMNGPSQLFFFPQKHKIMIAGHVIFGTATSHLLVYALPEMVLQANAEFPGQEDTVSAFCAGIFNSFLGVGQILGPLYGSLVRNRIGFRFTENIVACLNLFHALMYLFAAGGMAGFKALCNCKKERQRVKKQDKEEINEL